MCCNHQSIKIFDRFRERMSLSTSKAQMIQFARWPWKFYFYLRTFRQKIGCICSCYGSSSRFWNYFWDFFWKEILWEKELFKSGYKIVICLYFIETLINTRQSVIIQLERKVLKSGFKTDPRSLWIWYRSDFTNTWTF